MASVRLAIKSSKVIIGLKEVDDAINKNKKSINDFNFSVKGLEKSLNSMLNTGKNAFRDLASITKVTLMPVTLLTKGFAALETAILAGSAASVIAAGDFEMYRQTLRAVVSTKEEADKAFAESVQFAAVTPFRFDEIMQVRTELEAVGVKGKAAVHAVASAAAAFGREIKDVADAIKSMETEPLRRLGIQLKKDGDEFLFQFVDTMGRARSLYINGLRQAQDALLNIFESKFSDSIEKIALTLHGLWSTTLDSFKILRSSFGEGMIGPVKLILQDLNALMDNLTPKFKSWGEEFGEKIFEARTAIITSLDVIGLVYEDAIEAGTTFGKVLDVALSEGIKVLGIGIASAIQASLSLWYNAGAMIFRGLEAAYATSDVWGAGAVRESMSFSSIKSEKLPDILDFLAEKNYKVLVGTGVDENSRKAAGESYDYFEATQKIDKEMSYLLSLARQSGSTSMLNDVYEKREGRYREALDEIAGKFHRSPIYNTDNMNQFSDVKRIVQDTPAFRVSVLDRVNEMSGSDFRDMMSQLSINDGKATEQNIKNVVSAITTGMEATGNAITEGIENIVKASGSNRDILKEYNDRYAINYQSGQEKMVNTEGVLGSPKAKTNTDNLGEVLTIFDQYAHKDFMNMLIDVTKDVKVNILSELEKAIVAPMREAFISATKAYGQEKFRTLNTEENATLLANIQTSLENLPANFSQENLSNYQSLVDQLKDSTVDPDAINNANKILELMVNSLNKYLKTNIDIEKVLENSRKAYSTTTLPTFPEKSIVTEQMFELLEKLNQSFLNSKIRDYTDEIEKLNEEIYDAVESISTDREKFLAKGIRKYELDAERSFGADYRTNFPEIAAKLDEIKEALISKYETNQTIGFNKQIEDLRFEERLSLLGGSGKDSYISANMLETRKELMAAYGDDLDKVNAKAAEYEEILGRIYDNKKLVEFAESTGNAFANMFERMIMDAQDVDDALRQLGLEIARLILQKAALEPLAGQISGIITGVFNPGSPAPASSPGTDTNYYNVPVGGWKNGGIFPGGIKFNAAGDVFDQPMFFTSGGKANVMGEAGPEAVTPLFRGPDGKLGIKDYSDNKRTTASPITINVTNETNQPVDFSVVSVEDQLDRRIVSATLKARRTQGFSAKR